MSLLSRAMKLGCQNKDYPDKYGHYREAKYCQTKNHWFWKVDLFIVIFVVVVVPSGRGAAYSGPILEAFFVSGPLRYPRMGGVWLMMCASVCVTER